jgi:hypothetical protein
MYKKYKPGPGHPRPDQTSDPERLIEFEKAKVLSKAKL